MKKAIPTKPISIMSLVGHPELQGELASVLNGYDYRAFQSVEAALEAIYSKYFIPDLVMLYLSAEENKRFCNYFMEDLHLALVPVLLLHDQPIEEAQLKQMGITEALSFPLSPDQLIAMVQKYEQTRRKWWKSLHVYSAERPEKLLRELGLENKKARYSDRDSTSLVVGNVSRTENFPQFREFLFDRLDYCKERAQYLHNFSSEQVYELGEALYLDSFQTAGHLADFFHLKNITNLDSYELVIGALADQFCRRNLVLPLLDEAGNQCVALGNPFQLEVLDILDKVFKSYELLVAPPELIEEVLNPEFRNTERYRDWQLQRHIRSGSPRNRQERVRIDLSEDPVANVFTHERPPRRSEPLPETNFPSAQEMVQEQLRHHEQRSEPVMSRSPHQSQAVDERLSRAYQAFLDQNLEDDRFSVNSSRAVGNGDKDPEDAPVIHMVNCLIEKAHEMNASDIHIEPWENEVVIRYRVDGRLRVVKRLHPQSLIKKIITRLKIMSNLDIAERRLPQDGNIPFVAFSPGHDINLRVSIVPLAHGEKAVMRLLDPQRNLLELEDMGYSELALSQYRQKIHSPYGMILHVGPTGSGKTTTLYAALNEINDPDLNIHTIENPVEYKLPGVNQLEIKHDIGLDFARALRAYLRQDPDVILVGEIRDEETAHVAVEAAMTGHLLFSTLHTNDAASTVVRLLEMGIKPYMISSSLLMICAQRLIRRLCMHCRQPYEADMGVKHMMGISGEQKLILHSAVGCEQCENTGYSGRVGIFELLIPNDTLRQVMNLPHVSSEQIKDAAIRTASMRTLYQDAVDKTIQGLTSIEEMTLHILPDEHYQGNPWNGSEAGVRPQTPYPIPKVVSPVPVAVNHREPPREPREPKDIRNAMMH